MEKALEIAAWVAASGRPELAPVFAAIAGAAAQIAEKIRYAGLEDVYGAAGATNVQGEQQQKLDVFANDVMTAALRACPAVQGLVSEEDDGPVLFAHEAAGGAQYVVCFDPLDGSSNIDVNVNVGTIFGVRALAAGQDLEEAVRLPGREQVAAGYVVYGPSVVFVATVGDGVAAFTLGQDDTFVQSAERLEMPAQGPYYSANEANARGWPATYREFLRELLPGGLGGVPYSARYIGSLVADFHRTLLKGGVFLYPPTEKAPGGKLRLQYEANPLAMLAEQAGGAATDGKRAILEVHGDGLHQRTALVVGSRREVETLQQMLEAAS